MQTQTNMYENHDVDEKFESDISLWILYLLFLKFCDNNDKSRKLNSNLNIFHVKIISEIELIQIYAISNDFYSHRLTIAQEIKLLFRNEYVS